MFVCLFYFFNWRESSTFFQNGGSGTPGAGITFRLKPNCPPRLPRLSGVKRLARSDRGWILKPETPNVRAVPYKLNRLLPQTARHTDRKPTGSRPVARPSPGRGARGSATHLQRNKVARAEAHGFRGETTSRGKYERQVKGWHSSALHPPPQPRTAHPCGPGPPSAALPPLPLTVGCPPAVAGASEAAAGRREVDWDELCPDPRGQARKRGGGRRAPRCHQHLQGRCSQAVPGAQGAEG